MKRFSLISLLILIAMIFCCVSPALAQTGTSFVDNSPRWALPMDPPIEPMMGDWYIKPEWTSRLNLQDLKVAQERLPKIVEEMKRLNDSTRMGQFRWGVDVYETRIWFAPDSGFVKVGLNTCLHAIDKVSHGRCEVSGDRVTLIFETQSDSREVKSEKLIFARVFQGKAEFLIPRKDFPFFCRQGQKQGFRSWNEMGWLMRNEDEGEYNQIRDVVRVPVRYRGLIPKSLRRQVRVIHPAC
jgi:hypothetical protein